MNGEGFRYRIKKCGYCFEEMLISYTRVKARLKSAIRESKHNIIIENCVLLHYVIINSTNIATHQTFGYIIL